MSTVELILPTIHRVVEVKRLFESLIQQTYRDFHVVVVDQNHDARLDPVVERYSRKMLVTHVHSPSLGAARARNVGFLYTQGEILLWPDDDCWYPSDLLEHVVWSLKSEPHISGIVGILVNEKGEPHNRWNPQQTGQFTLYDAFIRAAEPVLIFRRQVVERVGGFDDQIGTGAQTPWGAGEGTDLCVRAIRAGAVIQKNPEIKIFHAFPPVILNDFEQRRKVRLYARGMGAVLKKNQLEAPLIARYFLTYFRSLLWNSFCLKGKDVAYHWIRLKGVLEGWYAYPDANKLSNL